MTLSPKFGRILTLVPLGSIVTGLALISCAKSGPVMTPQISKMPSQASTETSVPATIPMTPRAAPTAAEVCPEVGGLLPSEVEGTLVLLSTDGGIYIIDLPSLEMLRKPDSSGAFVDSPIGFPLTSPGASLLGIVQRVEAGTGVSSARRLRIIDASGRDAVEPLVDNRWASVTSWTNNGQLTITDGTLADGTIIVVDPFTGVESVLPPGMPDLDVHDPITWYALGVPVVVYDPSLTRAVYFAYDKFVLWNVSTGQALATQMTGWTRSLPMWAQDGSRVVVVVDSRADPRHQELVLLGRDGPATEVTHLHRSYTSKWIHAASPSWSPDGTRIAFWIGTQDSEEISPQWHLAIIDLPTSAITDYCLSQQWASLPIWSPDGHYIALRDGLIVDAQGQAAFRIDIDTYADPLGWLSSTRESGD